MHAATVSRRAAGLGVLALLGALAFAPGSSPAQAATPITVAQAIAQQGTSATVRGYIVGQPTATSTVIRSNFTADTAFALADSPSTTATGSMVYVQVTAAFRAAYGLASNPSRLGTRVDVTGSLEAYFAHAGLKSPTAIAPAGSTPTPSPSTDAYYAAALGKTGNSLRTALHQITSTGVTDLTYAQVWEALKVTDQDPANPANVILLYSGRSQSKTTNGGNPDQWNREHVWPQSHGGFGTSVGPGTDVHHLRPEDVSVNGERGNKDFDTGGTAVAEAPGNYTDSNSWEPRNAVKGDVARMIFYMAVRYEGDDGAPDLELDDAVTGGSAPRMGRLSVLRQWHSQDPPDAFERRRNQVIHDSFQHNRNPFIDHPEWVSSIFG